MAKDKQMDFESSLKALESIVKRLEDENINLEDSVKSFEEGINLVKEHFPFVKDIFEFKNLELPQNLFFDAVIDPFADTHLKKLQNHLNFGANYVTCGMYNQSKEKFNSEASLENLPGLLSGLISRNVSLIGNCLGTTEDLETGVNILAKDSDSNIVIDSVFNENDINTFIEKSFNKSSYKVGKVILLF